MTERIQRNFRVQFFALLAVLAATSAWAADRDMAKPVGDPLPHDGWVRGACFSPDGKYVVTGSFDGDARIWEVSTGKLVAALKNSYPVWSVTYSPDGSTILVGSGDDNTPGKEVGEAQLWDAATFVKVGKPLPTKGPIFNVGFGIDRKRLVLMTICTDGNAQRWNALTGDPLGDPLNFKKSLWCGAMSPDASTLVVSPIGKTANIWVPSGAKPDGLVLRHDFTVQGIAFSPDGKYFATAAGRHVKKEETGPDGGEVRVWETATGDEVGPQIKREKMGFHEVALTADGKRVLCGGGDKEVELFDVATGKRIGARMKVPGAVLTLAISPDGKYFIVGGTENKAQLYELVK